MSGARFRAMTFLRTFPIAPPSRARILAVTERGSPISTEGTTHAVLASSHNEISRTYIRNSRLNIKSLSIILAT